ncbi:hypothetical protein N8Z47_02310 [Salibacteraceae bacterium]|nr:hypothetical protein [Salibacteraceae bacterium]
MIPKASVRQKHTTLLLEKKKDRDFQWTGAASIGGDIFKYDVDFNESKQESSVVLESITNDRQDIVINTLANPKGKDIIVNHAAISPNFKYSVVYSSSVMGKTFREHLQKIPYLGIAFAYFKKRDPIFYERVNTYTVFDKDGNIAWTKTFTMGGDDTACYVTKVAINDIGTVFIHATVSPLRNHYFDIKDMAVGGLRKVEFRANGIYSMRKSEARPVRLDYKEKDTEEFKLSAMREKFFFSGNEYLRVAIVETRKKKDGPLNLAEEALFGGFIVNNLNNPKVPTIFIPVGLFDLQQSITKKETRKLDKGDAIEISIPEVRGVHLSSKSGIYLFIEMTDFDVLAGARYEYSFENLIVLNSSFKGKINWSELIPQKQEVWKAKPVVGGFHAIKSGGSFMVIQNDTKDGEIWKGETTNDEVWIRKLNAKADVVKEYRFEAGKNPICPRRTFVNMNGELIFIGEKPVGEVHIGAHAKKESTSVGRITIK